MADVLPNENEIDSGTPNKGEVSEKPRAIDNIEDPETIRDMQRPANIKFDMREMERNKRVSLILNSQAFREELEAIIDNQLKLGLQNGTNSMSGHHPASLMALQQISELVLPHYRFNQTSSFSSNNNRAGGSIMPVADIRNADSESYIKGEKILRCKLASLYRLVEYHGWTHSIYNHISARVSAEQDHFLINPFGLLYSEITASSLIKIDTLGNIVQQGTTTYGPNLAGFTIHSAIHNSRPDTKCILHVHTSAAAAVSTMKCGLLPISQEALICGEVSYYDYTGIVVEEEQKDQIIRALGPKNKILFLRNHGIVCCGGSIEEAYFLALNCVAACEIQIRAVAVGLDNVIHLPDEVRDKVREATAKGAGGVSETGHKLKVGELEFEAMMRHLDNMGYRTGYVYRQPFVRHELKPKSDVAYPAASTNFTYIYDNDFEKSKYESPIKMLNRRQAGEKTKWLNTPNTYSKVEVAQEYADWGEKEEVEGEDEGYKSKIHWVGDKDHKSGDSLAFSDPQQFARQGQDPKEYKKKAKTVRQERFGDKTHPGPISEVLAGITYGDARRTQPIDPNAQVYAKSKGIIQREYQDEAVLYTAYAPNPFTSMSEREILDYKKEIADKTGQDVKEIELIVQAEETEIKETKEESEDGEKVKTQKITTKTVTIHGDEPGTVETTTVSIVNGEKEDDDDRAPSPTPEGSQSVEGSPSKDSSLSPTKKKKKFRTPSFLSKKKKDKKAES
ncbi:gamma-adducin-like isoform X3 [Apostichopus japonicus]|uniref:gamma-adducin-like isoform X3 n=1 Tax=Stichopus japonicus TaxID=307972 RepID=UPI003AB729FF